MTKLYTASTERPQSNKSLYTQLNLVSHGVHYMTFLFKPTEKYNTVTLRTNQFSLFFKPHEWEVMRREIWDGIRANKFPAIEFLGRTYSVLLLEMPSGEEFSFVQYDWGIKLQYLIPESLLVPPLNTSAPLDTIVADKDYIPF